MYSLFNLLLIAQASSRPIRKEKDSGAIIFMDSRFKDKMSWISDWVKKEIKIASDRRDVLTNELKQFWIKI